MSAPPFTVHPFCSNAGAKEHLLTLASLPLTFNLGDGNGVDIALVGPDDDSIGRGIAANPKCVVIDCPAAVSRDGLRMLLESGISAFPVLKVAPALKPCRSISALANAVLVRSCLSSTESAKNGRLEHLAALESVLGRLVEVTVLNDSGDAYWGIARTHDTNARVLWNGRSAADRDRFDLDVIGIEERLEVDVAFHPTAKPADIRIGARDGIRQLRGTFESGLRLFWREIALELAAESGSAIPLNAVISLLDNRRVFNTSIF